MEIDFMTCSPSDVIARSAAMHPSLFAEALRDAARLHLNFCNATTNKQAEQTARTMAWEFLHMARNLESERFFPESLSFAETVQALHVACKLQCVPRYLVSKIAARYVRANA